jgi:hypothetical protein
LPNQCDEATHADTRKLLQVLNRKLKIYILLAVVYGLVFINYIDLLFSGPGYHLWLIPMYFFPFFALSTLHFRRNFRLTLSLGLVSSLMNDVFYGPIGYFAGVRVTDLKQYLTFWLIPGGAHLFDLNLGFTVVHVYSWMMAASIYGRIVLICILIRAWKIRADERCINGKEVRQKTRLKFWDKIIEKL